MSDRKERFMLGEWVFDPYTGFVDSLVSEDKEGANYESVCEVSGAIGDPNGYLIAAAPEMYSSLKDMVLTVTDLLEAICSGEENTDCLFAVVYDEIDNAIQVLKKARGEE